MEQLLARSTPLLGENRHSEGWTSSRDCGWRGEEESGLVSQDFTLQEMVNDGAAVDAEREAQARIRAV